MTKNESKKFNSNRIIDLLVLAAFAVLVGVFSGTIVTVYNVIAWYGEQVSTAWYSAFYDNPALIPLIFVALAIGAVIIGTIIKFIPMARGSGIPQIEGAARGILKLKWFKILISSFALSLATIFLGLSAGNEGPSMYIGGAAGNGIAAFTKSSKRTTKFLITGGASTGLAVAFNAPLTGFIFAFEEAHKKFTPELFISTFFSVISGILTRNGLRTLFSLADPRITISSAFDAFNLSTVNSFTDLLAVVGCVLFGAILVGMIGIAFYFAVIKLKKVFEKITFFKGIGKFLIPFLLAGVFGLISIYEMGGGHELIQSLGTNGGAASINVSLNFATNLIVAIIVVMIMRFIAAVLNMSCGVPCGVFIPMLAIGAGAGALVSLLLQVMGMNAEFSDVIVIICMATFFTVVVKAPLTSIVMVFELTGSYNFYLLLPAMLGIAIGYFLGKVFKTEPIYEVLLNGFIKSEVKLNDMKNETFTLTIAEGSVADGRNVHDMLFPWNTLAVELIRGGVKIVPDGETLMQANDIIVFDTETTDKNDMLKELIELVGKQA